MDSRDELVIRQSIVGGAARSAHEGGLSIAIKFYERHDSKRGSLGEGGHGALHGWPTRVGQVGRGRGQNVGG